MSVTELDRALHKSVLKREATKEQAFREEQQRRDADVHLGFGATDMCKAELRKIIDSDKRMYYRTEELNDKLYIHYKGWKEIGGLECWTGLKAIHAECNAFDTIKGLHNCRNLRSLFLSENCIKRISGLDNCTQLWSLNLSNNFIERIEGLSKCTGLNTLTLAKNKIGFRGVEDLIELAGSSIATLDVQDNKIWDPDVLPEVFAQMEHLRVLYLKGNECGKNIPNYRKSITVYCEDLKYLDDRPVFPEDRRAADAFNRGGLEEERVERRLIKDENNDKHDKNMKAFQAMIDAARSEKRERDAMRGEDKYTDESDPVESVEQRMKKQIDKWKEENKDDLREDMRDYAERCVKSEREAKENAKNKSQVQEAESEAWNVGFDRGSADRRHLGGPNICRGVGENEMSDSEVPPPLENEPQTTAGDEKIDNRKLVYEDIWDAAPAAKTATEAKAVAAPAKFVPPPRRAAASAAASADADAAAPSSSSSRGGVAAAESVEQQRDAALKAAAEAGKAPAWYAKFAEIAGKTAAPSSTAAAGDAEAGGAAKDFIAAKTFTGSRPGMSFKTGPEGLGYYADGAAQPVPPPPAAAAERPGDGAELDEMD